MFGILINFLIGFNAINCTSIDLDKEQIIEMFEDSEIQTVCRSLRSQVEFCLLNQEIISTPNYSLDDFKQRIELLLADYSALMTEYGNINADLGSKIRGTKTNIEHLTAHMTKLLNEGKNASQFEDQLKALEFKLCELLKKQQTWLKLMEIFSLEMKELEYLIKNEEITFCDSDCNRYKKRIEENPKLIAELEMHLNR